MGLYLFFGLWQFFLCVWYSGVSNGGFIIRVIYYKTPRVLEFLVEWYFECLSYIQFWKEKTTVVVWVPVFPSCLLMIVNIVYNCWGFSLMIVWWRRESCSYHSFCGIVLSVYGRLQGRRRASYKARHGRARDFQLLWVPSMTSSRYHLWADGILL